MSSANPRREFVRSAVERGYFEVPRRTTLQALADEYGISDVEASKRLRTELDAILRESLDESVGRPKLDPETDGNRR
jgi:predicted DNA binding protein